MKRHKVDLIFLELPWCQWVDVISFLESYKDFLNLCLAVPGLYVHCTKYPKTIKHLVADCNFDKKLFKDWKLPDHVKNVVIRKTNDKDEYMFPSLFELIFNKEYEEETKIRMIFSDIKFDDDRTVNFECAQCKEVKEWKEFKGVTPDLEIKCHRCGRYYWGSWII